MDPVMRKRLENVCEQLYVPSHIIEKTSCSVLFQILSNGYLIRGACPCPVLTGL